VKRRVLNTFDRSRLVRGVMGSLQILEIGRLTNRVRRSCTEVLLLIEMTIFQGRLLKHILHQWQWAIVILINR